MNKDGLDQNSAEVSANIDEYRTASAVKLFSYYRLFIEEEYLFGKYYKLGDTILDLACGMGRTTLLLHEMGMSVKGIDRSDIFIEHAKKRFPYLDLSLGSFDHIEEPDSSFSHVLMSANAIDLAFPESQRVQALQECVRVLKPGGTLIYSSNNLKSLHWFTPTYRRRLLWKLRGSLKAYGESAYLKQGGLFGLWASHGFVVRQTESLGLKLLEMKWPRKFGIDAIDRYCAPYIHYAFGKPGGENG